MKIKTILLVTAVFSLALTALPAAADTVQATASTVVPTESSTPPTPTPTPAPTSVTIPTLLEQIHQAKQLLGPVNLNYAINPHYRTAKTGKGKSAKTKSVIASYSLDARDIGLAILDPSSGSITATIGSLNSNDQVTFPDQNYSITLNSFNGVNSDFTVSKPAGGMVLALKYLVSGTDSAPTKNAIVASLSPVIYVPYSNALAQPALAAYGDQYINSVIQNVIGQLQYLPSQSVPGETVTQAVKPSIVKALVYSEHTSGSAADYQNNAQDLVNRVNVLFAGNEMTTFAYSASFTGARGIAQFEPGTYAALVQKHPEAHLISDFVAGTSDHVNAVKAMYLLLDDDIGSVRVRTADAFNQSYMYDYGAASYNGGTSRVVAAVKQFGTAWYSSHDDLAAQAQASIGASKTWAAQIKAALKKTKDKATKATLNADLATASANLATAQGQLSAVQSASLRAQTVGYLAKMHSLIQLFNGQQILVS
jgi:hypothetical protein